MGKCANIMVPAFWMWVGMFVGTGDNSEHISRMCGECATVVAPAFLMWVGKFRGYGIQLRQYAVNMGGNVPASWCLLCGFGWEMFVGTGYN